MKESILPKNWYIDIENSSRDFACGLNMIPMKKNRIASLIIVAFHTLAAPVFGQETNPYFSVWDSLDLSGSSLPVLMPYNRIVDPAGEQIYFGDPDFENHAMDCAVSRVKWRPGIAKGSPPLWERSSISASKHSG